MSSRGRWGTGRGPRPPAAAVRSAPGCRPESRSCRGGRGRRAGARSRGACHRGCCRGTTSPDWARARPRSGSRVSNEAKSFACNRDVRASTTRTAVTARSTTPAMSHRATRRRRRARWAAFGAGRAAHGPRQRGPARRGLGVERGRLVLGERRMSRSGGAKGPATTREHRDTPLLFSGNETAWDSVPAAEPIIPGKIGP